MTPHSKLVFGVLAGLAALSWLVPGCGETSSQAPPDADGGKVVTATPDGGACVPLAACVNSACPSSPDGGFPCGWGCGQATLCGTVEFTTAASACSSSGCSGGIDAALSYAVNETNARCVLTAMENGTLGEVSWGTSESSAQGLSDYEEDLNIVGERQAYGWWQYETDSYSYGRYAGKQLKPASFFQTCLGSNDTATYLSCLQNAYEACP